MKHTTLGKELRKLRRQRDLNLVDVADGVGCTVSYVSDVERDQKTPSDEKIVQILELLGAADRIDSMLQLAAMARESVEIEVTREEPLMAELLVALKRRKESGELDDKLLRKMLEQLE